MTTSDQELPTIPKIFLPLSFEGLTVKTSSPRSRNAQIDTVGDRLPLKPYNRRVFVVPIARGACPQFTVFEDPSEDLLPELVKRCQCGEVPACQKLLSYPKYHQTVERLARKCTMGTAISWEDAALQGK
ncbi:hypothetical protein [Laspinema olomoucense]|uniref:hypothetical protein n=1 Tax=Laspinema olomoucense TaxID=3231600 RepID=UPI0021BA3CEC|nr:hypothetical protein [Laspinema sp. D3c]MCT7992574.1 hypothetical protein [Laspinema sp. D3c]